MKNIHILPTEKPSRLYLYKGNDKNPSQYGLRSLKSLPFKDSFTNQNIYITSDEEEPYPYALHIKKQEVLKINGIGENSKELFHDKGFNYQYECKKIILTTDQDLIKDGVQAIDDEFLQWFVKNPSCDEIEVEELCGGCGSNDGDCWRSKECNKGYFKNKYKIIIPKEEPKKVLTEEDIFNQKDIDAVTDYINKEQQKKHLIDTMKLDEEAGLYNQEIKLEEVFNDEKKENIKKFIDEIKNPSQPNQALEEAAERYAKSKSNADVFQEAHITDFTAGAEWNQEQNDTSKVTRVEVIQHSPPYNGRAFTKYNAKDVEIQFQDGGTTLKIFLK